jgi:phage N-6-adenine-methyltransferase
MSEDRAEYGDHVIENTALAEISQAELALQRASDIGEILELRDKSAAIQLFANAQGFKDAAQSAKIFQLKAERKAGDWLAENVEQGGHNKANSQDVSLLPDGISYQESSRWQLESKVPEEKFNEWVDESLANGWEISAAGLQRIAKNPHVSFNSGENEWYTPPEYIEAARRVMGKIDLDPASSEVANKTVGATVYFTAEDDGLRYSWDGRVWMNPPYSSDLIGKFTNKITEHFLGEEITEAVVLVNNATETAWFQTMLTAASAVCFLRGRVKFIDMDGNPSGAPLQGQAILYFGKNSEKFKTEFSEFGKILYA